jgi:hypothetical protein
MTMETDWAAIESSQGREIGPAERCRVEVAALRAETAALVTQAGHVEDCYASDVADIKNAAAAGTTVEKYRDDAYAAAFPADCDEL